MRMCRVADSFPGSSNAGCGYCTKLYAALRHCLRDFTARGICGIAAAGRSRPVPWRRVPGWVRLARLAIRGEVASHRSASECRYALIRIRALRGWLLRPEHRTPVVVGEVCLHEGQAAFGHFRVQAGGGAAYRGGEVPCVHGQFCASPIEAGSRWRTVLRMPRTQQAFCVGLERPGGVVARRGSWIRPVNRLASHHPGKVRRRGNDVVDQGLHRPRTAGCSLAQCIRPNVLEETSQLVNCAAKHCGIMIVGHPDNAIRDSADYKHRMRISC
jgi:hypothetical protein